MSTAEQIITRIKGLRDHLQADERPILTVPGIWDGGQTPRGKTCELILTNQRLIGYEFVTFPRERLFLESIALTDIKSVVLRHKSFEPMFRELMVIYDQHKVYLRSSRRHIVKLQAGLRSALEKYTSQANKSSEQGTQEPHPTPVYGQQDIPTPFERSPLGITLLFAGGIFLEIIGITLWQASGNSLIGFPLCLAGFLGVVTAFYTRRQPPRHKK